MEVKLEHDYKNGTDKFDSLKLVSPTVMDFLEMSAKNYSSEKKDQFMICRCTGLPESIYLDLYEVDQILLLSELEELSNFDHGKAGEDFKVFVKDKSVRLSSPFTKNEFKVDKLCYQNLRVKDLIELEEKNILEDHESYHFFNRISKVFNIEKEDLNSLKLNDYLKLMYFDNIGKSLGPKSRSKILKNTA